MAEAQETVRQAVEGTAQTAVGLIWHLHTEHSAAAGGQSLQAPEDESASGRVPARGPARRAEEPRAGPPLGLSAQKQLHSHVSEAWFSPLCS